MKQVQSSIKRALAPVIMLVMIYAAAFTVHAAGVSIDDVPDYSGIPYVEINNNVPDFSTKMINDAKNKTYESYAALDSQGRCGVCVASIDQSLMPTEERGEIGSIKPTGWHTVKYNGIVEGNYLYNRCHLIGYQLTGENANKKNLITGTRYLNTVGMLPFENEVADYLEKSSKNKVLYRVTPIFEDKNYLASGVQMEAYSLNDNGKSIQFNVYCYNVQPGIHINYLSGASYKDTSSTITPVVTKASTKKDTTATAAASTSSTSTKKESTTTAKQENTITQAPVQQEVQQQPVASTGDSTTCWLSATGSKYHSKNDCGRMNPNKATQTTVSAAEAAGYGRCSKCW